MNRRRKRAKHCHRARQHEKNSTRSLNSSQADRDSQEVRSVKPRPRPHLGCGFDPLNTNVTGLVRSWVRSRWLLARRDLELDAILSNIRCARGIGSQLLAGLLIATLVGIDRHDIGSTRPLGGFQTLARRSVQMMKRKRKVREESLGLLFIPTPKPADGPIVLAPGCYCYLGKLDS